MTSQRVIVKHYDESGQHCIIWPGYGGPRFPPEKDHMIKFHNKTKYVNRFTCYRSTSSATHVTILLEAWTRSPSHMDFSQYTSQKLTEMSVKKI